MAAESVATARALGRACLPQLEVVLEHGSVPMRAFAIDMLAELDPSPDAIEARAQQCLFADGDNEVKAAAVATLAHASSAASLSLLMASLAKRSPLIADSAEEALVRRSEPEATATLIAAYLGLALDHHPGRTRMALVIARRHDQQARVFTRSRVEMRDDTMESVFVDAVRFDDDNAALWFGFDHGGTDVAARAARTLTERELDEPQRRRLLAVFDASWRGKERGTAFLFQCAAAAILEGDPEEARHALRAAIAPSNLTDEAARMRAEGVLRALDVRLMTASDVTHPMPLPISPGWSAELAPLLGPLVPEELRRAASEIVAGLDWFRGPRPPITDASFEVELGDAGEPPLVFLVAGYRVEEGPLAVLSRGELAARGLHRIHHCYGGTACIHATLIGIPILLPEAHRAAALELASTMTSGGERLSATELAAWNAILASSNLPPLIDGHEALAWSAGDAHLSESLSTHETLRFKPRWAPWKSVDGLSEQPTLEAAGRFGARDSLRNLASLLPEGMAPRVLLIWGNSD